MLIVERVREDDVGHVARLAAKTLSEQYDPSWLAQHAARASTFLVARDVPTNAVVGFAVADKRACEAHLLAIAVDDSRRNEGIGSTLLREARQELRRDGAFKLELEVRADDPKAQTFYARHGFYPTGLAHKVYRDGADAVRMQRPL